MQHGDVIAVTENKNYPSLFKGIPDCTGLSANVRFDRVKAFSYAARDYFVYFLAIVERDGFAHGKDEEAEISVEAMVGLRIGDGGEQEMTTRGMPETRCCSRWCDGRLDCGTLFIVATGHCIHSSVVATRSVQSHLPFVHGTRQTLVSARSAGACRSNPMASAYAQDLVASHIGKPENARQRVVENGD